MIFFVKYKKPHYPTELELILGYVGPAYRLSQNANFVFKRYVSVKQFRI